MGYESKLFVVEKSMMPYHERDGMQYCQVIAMFDLCKFYPLIDILNYYPDTNCYFYMLDGNTRVYEDMYGDPLKEIPIADVIDVLEEELDKGENYRRIYPLLEMLKAFEEHRDQWHKVVVLHFGY